MAVKRDKEPCKRRRATRRFPLKNAAQQEKYG